MNKSQSKKFVAISLILAAVTSIAIAFIMSKNLSKDVSKERFRLTKDYKEVKDQDFKYTRELGSSAYKNLCASCHGIPGNGKLNNPSLIDSPLIKDSKKLIKLTLYGLKGKLQRGDKVYNSVMPGFRALPHEDLAFALTFVTQEFGKSDGEIPTVEIVKGKIDFIKQSGPYREEEL